MACTPPSLTSPFGSLQLNLSFLWHWVNVMLRGAKSLQWLVAGVQAPPPCSSFLVSGASSSTRIPPQPPSRLLSHRAEPACTLLALHCPGRCRRYWPAVPTCAPAPARLFSPVTAWDEAPSSPLARAAGWPLPGHCWGNQGHLQQFLASLSQFLQV